MHGSSFRPPRRARLHQVHVAMLQVRKKHARLLKARKWTEQAFSFELNLALELSSITAKSWPFTPNMTKDYWGHVLQLQRDSPPMLCVSPK